MSALRSRPVAMAIAAAAWLPGTGLAQPSQEAPATTVTLPEITVTATSRPAERSQIASTVQVIDEEAIRRSPAKSITDLLAENAVGFQSQWTPGQTSLNIRGGATDGQGRDFRSEVLVLVNGRRAGTANISKLSPAEIERIEIVRGPASVIYGSQAIGGVVNLITRNGLNSPGGFAETSGGSFGFASTRARYGGKTEGGTDYFVGTDFSRADDYRVGGGTRQGNTAYKRTGLTAELGQELGAAGRGSITIRTDGIYDAGFRGSSYSLTNKEDRQNASGDLVLDGATPDKRFRWNLHGYVVRDEDNFFYNSPVVKNGTLPGPGTLVDNNDRHINIYGTRLQPQVSVIPTNDLLLGFDAEKSIIRSDRFRLSLPGGPAGQTAPQDNNQTENVYGLYFEDAQRFFGDRLTVRGGVRHTWGITSFDYTPNLPAGQINRSTPYEATTASAGLAYRLTDWLTPRFGYATGFRAPTATDLAANYTTLGGGRIFGNPNLKPETNEQFEVGATGSFGPVRADLALFQNVIQDRIITATRPGAANTSDTLNNPGAVRVRGIELQLDADAGKLVNLSPDWRWRVSTNGNYNFEMRDDGGTAGLNNHSVQRMYKYQATISTTVGQEKWDVTALANLYGPVFYDTEENLLVPQGEPYSTFVHKKAQFWLFNLRASYRLKPGFEFFGTVNNLLDINRSAIFIAQNRTPYVSDPRFTNGGRGNSIPGRELIGGIRATF